MLKKAVFVFACVAAISSTAAFAAVCTSVKAKSGVTVPAAPKPQGFCWPAGTHC